LPIKLHVSQKGRLKSRPHFPMSMQPVEHLSIALNQQPAVVSTSDEDKMTSPAKDQQARMQAVRAAKARIMRRNSLRMQRQALKR